MSRRPFRNLEELINDEKRGRPIDSDEAGRAIYVELQRYRGIPRPVDAEVVIHDAFERLWQKWKQGRYTLEAVKLTASITVKRLAWRASKKARDAGPSLDQPVGEDVTLGQLIPSRELTPDERAEVMERLDPYVIEEQALHAYLRSAPPHIRAIERLALEGLERPEIVRRLAAEGHELSHANVRQIIHRKLIDKFPLHSWWWENKQRRDKGEDAVPAEKENRSPGEDRYRAAERASGEFVRAIADSRRMLAEGRQRLDWALVAANVGGMLGRTVTSLEARRRWGEFITGLPRDLRRFAP